jgi:hypothetical protein
MSKPWRPRDENGWIIPTCGTKSYVVYMAMITEDPIEDAATVIGRSKRYAQVVANKIRNAGSSSRAEMIRRAADYALT